MEQLQETKYFTPDIEDIRVGYECEISKFKEWTPTIITWDYNIDGLTYCMKVSPDACIRVPYLTKEQIEAEGWKSIGRSTDIWFEKEGDFEIGSWTSYKIRIHYGLHDKRLYVDAIDRGDEVKLFQGECKDINTFRFICKLLGI